MNKNDAMLFLRALKEEGIEEVYLPSAKGTRSLKGVEVPGPSGGQKDPVPSETASAVKEAMLSLRSEALQCTRCQELSETRQKVVFGAGNLKAKLVFVGEAPGKEEDAQGLPFVGAAGQLLTKIIEAIGYTRKQVFICNVLKCRPPGNRSPVPEEIQNCSPYLKRQIELIRPRIICALGSFAAKTLLNTDRSIGQLRGRFHEYEGIPLVCTYHPAYLLRNPADKRKVWEDMKMLKKRLEAGE